MDFANPGLGRTYGGLDFMAGGDPGSPRFGTPAWDLVSVSQDDEGRGGDDLIAFHRVHQFPFVSGYDESRLQASSGTDPLVPPPIDPLVGNFPVLYDEMETLNWGVVSNGRPNSGLPAWIIFNFGSDASQDGISALAPGLILAELVSLTPLSTPAPAQPVIIQNTVVDATTTVVLPPFMPVSTGDVIRLQAIYSEPLGPLFLAASNEAWFTGLDVNDVLVELDGSGSPYSRVSELTGDPAKAIAKVVFDFGPGSLLPGDNWVDTDLVQADGSNKIFAAGNGTVPGCMGTYRNGSDIATGLIYAGSDIIDLSENGSDLPPCYTQLQSLDGMGNPIVPITGFTGSNHVDGTNRHPRTIEFNFALGQFKGLTFEFDARIQSTHFVGTGTRSFAGTRVRVERADGSSFEGHLIPEKANSPISLIGW